MSFQRFRRVKSDPGGDVDAQNVTFIIARCVCFQQTSCSSKHSEGERTSFSKMSDFMGKGLWKQFQNINCNCRQAAEEHSAIIYSIVL